MSTIKKGKFSYGFSTVPNKAFQDINLTWKAKGLLIYLLTLPEDWEIRKSDLANRAKDGYDSMDSGFNELIKMGYIIEDGETRKEGMFSGKNYLVFPEVQKNTDKENPERLSPPTDRQFTVTVNPDLHNIHSNTPYSRITKKTKKTNIKFSPPSIAEVIDYFLIKGYKKEVAEKAFSYYEANDWKDSSNKKVVNWKQKMISVWFREENKEPIKNESNQLKMVY